MRDVRTLFAVWPACYATLLYPEGITGWDKTGQEREPRIPGVWQRTRGAVQVVCVAGDLRAQARKRCLLPGVTGTCDGRDGREPPSLLEVRGDFGIT